jgi:2-polyprenyl-3-methyl-5-hydroxy-6-metoxy-1,4-benzoquinol methylase|tara:strand:- start:131 stop:829 length:699 start_codon:yes stop_codon:yes gene_type:complete
MNKKIHNNSNDFWKEYSKREDLTLNSLMNLEADAEKSKTKFIYEKKRLESIFKYNPKWNLVDLGGGVGLWSEYFSEHINKVTLVEREEKFIELAKQKINNKNIEIIHSDVVDFNAKENSFDVVFISGVTLYLDDEYLLLLMNKVKNYLKPNGIFIHRDAYGINQKFLLDSKKSENLKLEYSAVYRTRTEYDNIFVNKNDFEKIYDEDMYPEETKLNVRRETKLRIAIYKNIK